MGRWPMVMALASLLELTMAMALSLDMELSVTVATMVAMLAMEVSITASTENVKPTVILMPTQLVRLLMDMLMVLSPELITAMALCLDMEPLETVAMLVMLDTEVTLDTSSDKCLPGHCPATYLLNDFTCFLKN